MLTYSHSLQQRGCSGNAWGSDGVTSRPCNLWCRIAAVDTCNRAANALDVLHVQAAGGQLPVHAALVAVLTVHLHSQQQRSGQAQHALHIMCVDQVQQARPRMQAAMQLTLCSADMASLLWTGPWLYAACDFWLQDQGRCGSRAHTGRSPTYGIDQSKEEPKPCSERSIAIAA